jgi:hypothetical protein
VCITCKGDFPDLAEIDCPALSEHLAVNNDGVIESHSRFVQAMVDVCALNRPELVAFRRDLLASLAILEGSRAEEAARLRRRYRGYLDDIVARQKIHRWGKSVVERLARDLQLEFPGMTGFSPRNVWRMRAV